MGNCYVKRGEKNHCMKMSLTYLVGVRLNIYQLEIFVKLDFYTSILKTLLGTPDKDTHGFLIECDLECPSSIHEKSKYFPFLPEKENNQSRKCFTLYDKKRPKV